MQVGCYGFHFDLKWTIYLSRLPTSFHYHHGPLFQTTKSSLKKHLSKVRAGPNLADGWAHHTMHHSLARSNNTDSNMSSAKLSMQPPSIRPWMHIWTLTAQPQAARTRSGVQLDVSIFISPYTAVNWPYNVWRVHGESYMSNVSLCVTGSVHGRPRHLSTQSKMSNIILLSAVGLLWTKFMIRVHESGR